MVIIPAGILSQRRFDIAALEITDTEHPEARCVVIGPTAADNQNMIGAYITSLLEDSRCSDFGMAHHK